MSWARMWVIAVGSLGCVRSEPPTELVDTPPSLRSEPVVSAEPPALAEPAPQLLIDDPLGLIALERTHGLSLASLLHGDPGDAGATTPTGSYGQGPLEAIAQALAARLAADRREQPEQTGVGLRHVHRQFDLRWLAAPDARFELIGVVNRMDREVFAPERQGETRLIYRLAYTKTQRGVTVDSRLPMTLNVVFWQAGESREQVQDRWRAPAELAGPELAAWLRADGHALAPAQLDPTLLKSVEINVQTERWPSTIRPDMAGHAEYLLMVFHRTPAGGPGSGLGGWEPAPLENTPDLARLRRDGAARAELLAWLRDPAQRDALERGTLVVPKRFLATAATSVTPRGFARLSNRSWSQLFTPEDFADYPFEGLTTVRSPAALLRRLDGLSCQGCHESRSIAGFHLLGAERDRDRQIDALAVSNSPHLEGELERRAAWHAAVSRGEPASEARPLSEHERNRGAWGTHCGLGDPGFAAWTCAAGLVCTALSDPELGTCLEPGPAGAGGVCEVGVVAARADHHRDRVTEVRELACADGGVCNDNRVGFPEGMCAFACDAPGSRRAGSTSGCGAIPNLRSFNDCLAARRPFAACIEDAAFPAAMRACSSDAPCRDDYICARSGSDAGVCLPPYFLFQLRVDGHPA